MTLGTTWPVMKSKEEGAHRLSVTRSGVGVGRVKLELQNLVEKHHEPLAKLRAEGIKGRVARALANLRWPRSRAERVQWRGNRMEWKEGGKKFLLLDAVM
jgi:hypothetical protein